jgi:hypothetical protein
VLRTAANSRTACSDTPSHPCTPPPPRPPPPPPPRRPPPPPPRGPPPPAHHHAARQPHHTGTSGEGLSYEAILEKFRAIERPIDKYLTLRDLLRLSPKVGTPGGGARVCGWACA